MKYPSPWLRDMMKPKKSLLLTMRFHFPSMLLMIPSAFSILSLSAVKDWRTLMPSKDSCEKPLRTESSYLYSCILL